MRTLRGLWGEFKDIDPGLMAAAVAYNAFFALVPVGFAFVTAASFIGLSDSALARTEETLRRFAPEEVTSFIVDLLRDVGELVDGQHGWIIVVSVVLALWSGSRGVITLQKALAKIEGMEEDRSRLAIRGIGVGLTVAGGLALALVSATLVAGGRVVDFMTDLTDISALNDLWNVLRFPVGVGGLFLFLLAVYHWGPPRPLPGSWLAAIVAASGTLGSSYLLGVYLRRVGELGTTFGVLGTVAIILLWLFVGAYVILLGASTVAYFFRGRMPAQPR